MSHRAIKERVLWMRFDAWEGSFYSLAEIKDYLLSNSCSFAVVYHHQRFVSSVLDGGRNKRDLNEQKFYWLPSLNIMTQRRFEICVFEQS